MAGKVHGVEDMFARLTGSSHVSVKAGWMKNVRHSALAAGIAGPVGKSATPDVSSPETPLRPASGWEGAVWTERDCAERRIGLADILSGWTTVAAILGGVAAWTAVRLLAVVATAPVEAGDASAAGDAPPLVLGVERPE